MVELEVQSNVVHLDKYRQKSCNVKARQEKVRLEIEGSLAADPPVAYTAVAVASDGRIFAEAMLVEPEYVPGIVDELEALIHRLKQFAEASATSVLG